MKLVQDKDSERIRFYSSGEGETSVIDIVDFHESINKIFLVSFFSVDKDSFNYSIELKGNYKEVIVDCAYETGDEKLTFF